MPIFCGRVSTVWGLSSTRTQVRINIDNRLRTLTTNLYYPRLKRTNICYLWLKNIGNGWNFTVIVIQIIFIIYIHVFVRHPATRRTACHLCNAHADRLQASTHWPPQASLAWPTQASTRGAYTCRTFLCSPHNNRTTMVVFWVKLSQIKYSNLIKPLFKSSPPKQWFNN